MYQFPSECKTLITRLKKCDLEEIVRNPSLMVKFYPIRDPDKESTIFDEIYPLLHNGFLSRSYRFRLLFFINTMLSSTNVPAFVIATYIKKLSRLSLKARPRTLVMILGLVGNLFLRHPMLKFLRDKVVDRVAEMGEHSDSCTLQDWMNDDPFDDSELINLKNTRAMDSCIWELMPLRFHRCPRVARAAEYLGQNEMLEMETDFDDIVR